MFVVVTVTNIISLNCNIPIPLHTVFKSVSIFKQKSFGTFIFA